MQHSHQKYTSSRPPVSARPGCARGALVPWDQEAVKLLQKVRSSSLPTADPSLTDALATSPSLYLTACGSVSLWEPKCQGAGKTQRQPPSSGATQSPLTSVLPPSTSAPSIVFASTSSAYFGNFRLLVTFSSPKHNPMTVYAFQGPAHDLAPAVYDVGKMSRPRFPHRLAPARLIPLKPLSGFPSHSHTPLHLPSRLGSPQGSHLTAWIRLRGVSSLERVQSQLPIYTPRQKGQLCRSGPWRFARSHLLDLPPISPV